LKFALEQEGLEVRLYEDGAESMRFCGATESPIVLVHIALPLIELDRSLTEGPLSLAAPQNLMLPMHAAA
jgi:hypothetical protein